MDNQNINEIVEIFTNPFGVWEMILFISVAILVVVIFIVVIKIAIAPKPKTPKEILKAVDFKKSEGLFEFSALAQKIDDSNKLDDILKKLEKYKYDPNHPPLPKQLMNEIERYIDDIDK